MKEERLKVFAVIMLVLIVLSSGQLFAGDEKGKTISFKEDVYPIVKNNCLPCHAEDNFNPSELSLDTYELMKQGGQNGPTWVAGDSKKSILVQKLMEEPPFDARMPLNSKRKIKEGKAKWLTDEEIKLIADWVDQGAKDN